MGQQNSTAHCEVLPDIKSPTVIYVLELADGNYYVGRSSNVAERMIQHCNGEGSAWTQKYKPKKVLETREELSAFDENNITKEYMQKYGIDHVRGGSYCQVKLENNTISLLNQELWAAESDGFYCYRCGRAGHSKEQCYAKSDKNGKYICDEVTEHENIVRAEEPIEHKANCEKKTIVTCFRCGRSGHFQENCYAKSDKNGKYICDEEPIKLEAIHEKKIIETRRPNYNNEPTEHKANCEKKTVVTCFRCGRSGHFQKNCYAKTNVDNKKL
jgi:predicted GIY-YIG superfamily endonuclease